MKLPGIFATVFFITSLFVIAVTVRAQNAGFSDDLHLPEGYRGKAIAAFIQAINSHDPVTIKHYFLDYTTERFRTAIPFNAHISTVLGLYRQTGGVEFYSIRSFDKSTDSSVVVICRSPLFGNWYGYSFLFNDDQKLVDRMGNRYAAPPANEKTERALNEAEMVKNIRNEMIKLNKNSFFSGAVLVAHNDKILYSGAWGEASKSWHIKNNIDTRFNLGSMNKMFTAIAAMQLVEQGKLQLTDTISRYIDESWYPREITSQVTVHQLLSHTGGFGNFFNAAFNNTPRDKLKDIDDYKQLLKNDTLVKKPGSGFLYSNIGMLLVGVIIEKVSGESYFDYVREHIYKPAGMEHTDCYDLGRPQENLAEGYIPDPDGGWKNNTFIHVMKGGPAGGGYSTVTDLYRFARALMTGKLVSDSTREKMFTPYSAWYGYGFVIENAQSEKVVGHSGGFPGLNSNLGITPGKGYISIVMSNYDFGALPLARLIQQYINLVK